MQAGLSQCSPNEAPLLVKPEEFKARVSSKVYRNMSKALQGRTSLRDLSFKFKQGNGFLKLACAIAPDWEKGLIQFEKIQDLHLARISRDSYTTITFSELPEKKPILLAVDQTSRNQLLLSAIAQEQGYEFQAISDSVEAINQLKDNPNLPPAFLFFNPDSSVITETEFCTIVNRFRNLKSTTIIVYTQQGSLGKQKIRQALVSGASEYIDGKSFSYNYLNATLLKYNNHSVPSEKVHPHQTYQQLTYQMNAS